MAQAPIELDHRRWPLVVVRPRQPVSDAELDSFLVTFREVIRQQRGDYALILDLRFSKDMPPTQRKRISKEIEHGEVNDRCLGTAFVFTSSVMRMLLTAILWLARPKQELKVFSDYDEAFGWAQDRAYGGASRRRVG